MTKIYDQAKDVHVSNNIIYTKGDAAYKYVTCDGQYTKSELKDAFLKGAIIDIPAGCYGNEDHMLINPLSYINYDGDDKGYVNFNVPVFSRNKCMGEVADDCNNLTTIGLTGRGTVGPSGSELLITKWGSGPDAFGIEFGEGTLLYSVLSALGPIPKTISVTAFDEFNNATIRKISCGEDSKTFNHGNTPRRISLTTTGNVVRLEFSNDGFAQIWVSKLQVELGTEATEYEPPEKYGTEDLITIMSTVDPSTKSKSALKRIYENSKDVHVSNTIVYSKNNVAYKDATCSIRYTTKELKEAFLKGALVDVAEGTYDNDDRLLLIPSSLSLFNVGGGQINCSVPRIRKNKYQKYIETERYSTSNIGSVKSKTFGEHYIRVIGLDDGSIVSFGIQFYNSSSLCESIRKLRTDVGSAPITISMEVECSGKTDDTSVSIALGIGSDQEVFTKPVTKNYDPVTISITTTKSHYYPIAVQFHNLKNGAFYIQNVQVEVGPKPTSYEPPRDSDWVDVVSSVSIPDTM